jgi:uncharacterized protein (TIGR02001 family)
MMTKKVLILGVAVAAAINSGIAAADVSGNIAIASNYIWRGATQTVDQAATSGGLDWSDKSGLYAGTWVSNVDFSGTGDGYEQDYYVGFSQDNFDVGILTYTYPVTPNFNFTELYASGSFGPVTVGLNLTVDNASGNTGGLFVEDDIYVSASADVTDSVSVYFGSYMFDNDGAVGVGEVDYIHFGVSVSKDDFTFAIDKNDADPAVFGASTDNVRMTVSWGKEFEL